MTRHVPDASVLASLLPGRSQRPPSGVGAVWVALAPEVASLGPGLELTSRGRFSCGVRIDDADVHIVPPAAPAYLSELLEALPARTELVVVDARGGCPPDLVTDSLNAGVSAVVSGASYRVLVAHVDAVVRRRRRPRMTSAPSATASLGWAADGHTPRWLHPSAAPLANGRDDRHR